MQNIFDIFSLPRADFERAMAQWTAPEPTAEKRRWTYILPHSL
jgi:hypothetical protein